MNNYYHQYLYQFSMFSFIAVDYTHHERGRTAREHRQAHKHQARILKNHESSSGYSMEGIRPAHIDNVWVYHYIASVTKVSYERHHHLKAAGGR